MLRTCSEPDLAKLFRTSNNPFIDIAASATFGADSDSDTDEPDLSLQGMCNTLGLHSHLDNASG